jgi:histidinol-phosphate/aromatic aminotransferase/cobyric acid decarboxylase-like protein
MEANVARIKTTRARLADALARLGYRVPPSEANFVLARRPGVDQAPVARALAARSILVRHFATPALRDALRITVGHRRRDRHAPRRARRDPVSGIVRFRDVGGGMRPLGRCP